MVKGAASTKLILLAYGKRIRNDISDANNMLGHRNIDFRLFKSMTKTILSVSRKVSSQY